MKKMEEKVNYETPDFDVDDTQVQETLTKVEKPAESEYIENPLRKTAEAKNKYKDAPEEHKVNILRNERVIVRHIPKETGLITDPRHALYGGMAETASRTFVVPRLRSGAFVNVLTDAEKEYLEDAMGLEYGALNSTRKKDNFWDDSNDIGISSVRLLKQDNYLDLSQPEDYIRYKILLANKEYIAPSMKALQDTPKATYQYVIISEGDEAKDAKDNMSNTMKCYKEFGKVENDIDVLRVIIETIDGRPTASNSKLEFLQGQINKLIQANSKLFLNVITDPLLNTKVLIKQAIEAGAIFKKGDYYCLSSDGSYLCEQNEEPTLNIAAAYLNKPKHQDILFALQAKVNK